jgi:hypothetical protein
MRRLAVLISLVLAMGLITADVAYARRAGTSMTLRTGDNTVGSNDTIELRGKVSSRRAACRERVVTLTINGAPYGTTVSGTDGTYEFEVDGPHPAGRHKFLTSVRRNRRCKGATSNSLTVTVGG